MKFRDSSAIIPLLVHEQATEKIRRIVSDDEDMIVRWGTPVERTCAVARRERDEYLDVDAGDGRPGAAATAEAELGRSRTVRKGAFNSATLAPRSRAPRSGCSAARSGDRGRR